MKAWHFIKNDKLLGYGDGREVKVGETLSCAGAPKLCLNGMHGSKRLIDALQYAPGHICCRVEITGDVIEGDDKVVGRNRKVLGMVDAENILNEFACQCAEDALASIDNPDPRSVAAIKAKRDWVCGKITDDELAAAEAAAWAAVWAAADPMSGRAPAAKAAAEAAAWAAAWDMVWAAARDAVWAAASLAASHAALAVVWEKQNRRLTQMVVAAMKRR